MSGKNHGMSFQLKVRTQKIFEWYGNNLLKVEIFHDMLLLQVSQVLAEPDV